MIILQHKNLRRLCASQCCGAVMNNINITKLKVKDNGFIWEEIVASVLKTTDIFIFLSLSLSLYYYFGPLILFPFQVWLCIFTSSFYLFLARVMRSNGWSKALTSIDCRVPFSLRSSTDIFLERMTQDPKKDFFLFC